MPVKIVVLVGHALWALGIFLSSITAGVPILNWLTGGHAQASIHDFFTRSVPSLLVKAGFFDSYNAFIAGILNSSLYHQTLELLQSVWGLMLFVPLSMFLLLSGYKLGLIDAPRRAPA